MSDSLAPELRDSILRRICGEYLEMPGLRLTQPQAQRLWGLDERTCGELLDSLTRDKFLYQRADGTYARLTEGAFPAPRMAKATTSRPAAAAARTR